MILEWVLYGVLAVAFIGMAWVLYMAFWGEKRYGNKLIQEWKNDPAGKSKLR